METRLIKTCHGLKTVRLLDGAVLPPDVNPQEARVENIENRTLRQQVLNWWERSLFRSPKFFRLPSRQ